MTRYIVLGRFQPFHMGHEYLVKAAYEQAGEDDQLVIAIGSQQAGWEPTNPWTADERKAMIKDLQQIKRSLGEPGVYDRIAKSIVERL